MQVEQQQLTVYHCMQVEQQQLTDEGLGRTQEEMPLLGEAETSPAATGRLG